MDIFVHILITCGFDSKSQTKFVKIVCLLGLQFRTFHMYVLDWMEWSRTLGQAHGLRAVDKTIILLILNLSLS